MSINYDMGALQLHFKNWGTYKQLLADALDSINHKELLTASIKIHSALVSGNTVYLCGNGGSYATATHLVADFVKAGMRVQCLADNVPLLTAISNDHDYSEGYERALKVFVRPGDVVLFISCSGTSPNLMNALKYLFTNHESVYCISLTGIIPDDSSKHLSWYSQCVPVDSTDYQVIEDVHMSILHFIFREESRRLSGG